MLSKETAVPFSVHYLQETRKTLEDSNPDNCGISNVSSSYYLQHAHLQCTGSTLCILQSIDRTLAERWVGTHIAVDKKRR